MTLVARKTGVFTFQQVSSFFVIERFRIPLDEREILAIVFGVTSRALLTRSWRDVVGRMQAAVRRQTTGNFCMALKTLQRSLASELVAAGAIRGSVERLMGTR